MSENSESVAPPVIAITGASGFIGTNLRRYLDFVAHPYRNISLRNNQLEPDQFTGVDAVIHLSGIAHTSHPDTTELHRTNTILPIKTAKAARDCGVKQFVFLSSALVWGSENSIVGEDSVPNPDTEYGRAKLAAEAGLLRLGTEKFIVTVIRPPLVYGPGVRGNLLKLITAAEKWPYIPLGITGNRRSLISVHNLVAFIFHLVTNHMSGTFSIAEKKPFSTNDIVSNIMEYLPRHGTLIPPFFGARKILTMLKRRSARQLFGSFEIDPSTWRDTQFEHPFEPSHGFRTMVEHYLENRL